MLKILLLVAVAGYAAIVALVWWRQESLLFYPRPAPERIVPPAGWRLEEVSHTSADGTVLAGVLALPPLQRAPLLVYYGGNAEEATAFAPTVARLYGERAVLLVNYRGYGRSAGKPGERELVSDALELLDAMARRPDIDGSRIAVHGRSLGSGVAVQVAASRAMRCVVLTSPFTSARDVASNIYPWLPVRLLMRHPFDSTLHAAKLRMPALFLIGEADQLVRPSQSRHLAALWGGPARIVSLAGFGHNDLDLAPAYATAVREFLEAHH